MKYDMTKLLYFSLPRYLTALLSLRAVAKQSRVGIASSSRMLSRLLAMTFLQTKSLLCRGTHLWVAA